MCVILSMLFVLTSCSLLPDRKDRSERPAFNKNATSGGEAEENSTQPRNHYSTQTLPGDPCYLFYPLVFF